MPDPAGPGSTRRPTVARNGLPPAPMNSAAAPVPTGRSTQIVVVSSKLTCRPNSSARVASITSFWTSPYKDTVSSCRMSSWRRLISGSCSASCARAACRAPVSLARAGTTTVSSVGGAKWRCGVGVRPGPTVSPICTPANPADLGYLPGGHGRARHGRSAGQHAQPGDAPVAAWAVGHLLPGAQRPGEHPDVGDLLAGRPALDLEDGPCGRGAGVAARGRQELCQPGRQAVQARPGDSRAEVDRVHEGPARLRGELRAQPGVRQRPIVIEVGSEQRIVVVGQRVGETRGEARRQPARTAARSRRACRDHPRCPSRRPPASAGQRSRPGRGLAALRRGRSC